MVVYHFIMVKRAHSEGRCARGTSQLCDILYMCSNLHGRLPKRWRVRGAGAVQMRRGLRRRTLRTRPGRVRGARAPRRPRALCAPRALRQHTRLLLLRLQGRLQAGPAKGPLRR